MLKESYYNRNVSNLSERRRSLNGKVLARARERLCGPGILVIVVALCQPVFASPEQVDLRADATPLELGTGEHQRLTLDAALRMAQTLNPLLLAKRGEMDIAEGNLKQASIVFQHNPEFSIRSDSRRIPGSNNPPSSTQRFGEYEIGLSQEFEVWGQRRARRAASSATRDTTQVSIVALEYEILTLVRHRFYEAQVARRTLDLASEQFSFSLSILDMSKTQFEAGEISRTDYRQLEIQSAEIRARSLVAKSELEARYTELKYTLGLSQTTQLSIDGALRSPRGSSLEQGDIVAKVLENHPELRQAELLVTQREKEEAFVRVDAKPNLTGNIFIAEENGNEKFYGAGLSIPLNFFNRGQGFKAAAKAAIRVAEAQEFSVRNSLQSRALSTLERFRAAGEAATYYYEEVLPAVDANLAQLENAFRQGEIDMIELRVNQRDLLDAQSDALNRLGDYYYWLAEIEGLMGENLYSGSP